MLHINYTELYELFDLRIITNAIRAHYKHESEKTIENWRMVRHISLLYYNSQVKETDKIRNPADYLFLPGDKKSKRKQPPVLNAKQIDKIIQ